MEESPTGKCHFQEFSESDSSIYSDSSDEDVNYIGVDPQYEDVQCKVFRRRQELTVDTYCGTDFVGIL